MCYTKNVKIACRTRKRMKYAGEDDCVCGGGEEERGGGGVKRRSGEGEGV